MTRLAGRFRARTGPAPGPWFDHALVLVLIGVILADVWMAAYLLFRAAGLN